MGRAWEYEQRGFSTSPRISHRQRMSVAPLPQELYTMEQLHPPSHLAHCRLAGCGPAQHPSPIAYALCLATAAAAASSACWRTSSCALFLSAIES
mmetsp:Transcript_4363/g.13663  ORF Transcript_4363/g.13663 Transcript_4363/m.13663 type:complete len:95 (+) Transcript_4363:74-358(+)